MPSAIGGLWSEEPLCREESRIRENEGEEERRRRRVIYRVKEYRIQMCNKMRMRRVWKYVASLSWLRTFCVCVCTSVSVRVSERCQIWQSDDEVSSEVFRPAVQKSPISRLYLRILYLFLPSNDLNDTQNSCQSLLRWSIKPALLIFYVALKMESKTIKLFKSLIKCAKNTLELTSTVNS